MSDGASDIEASNIEASDKQVSDKQAIDTEAIDTEAGNTEAIDEVNRAKASDTQGASSMPIGARISCKGVLIRLRVAERSQIDIRLDFSIRLRLGLS